MKELDSGAGSNIFLQKVSGVLLVHTVVAIWVWFAGAVNLDDS